jgi:hypothetical protein
MLNYDNTTISRICKTCGKGYPEVSFHKSKTGKFGLRNICKTCISSQYHLTKKVTKNYSKTIGKFSPGFRKEKNWKYSGILNKDGSFFQYSDYLEILLHQDNRCYLCRTQSPGVKGWSVDHDHKTGFVRAILCNSCNLMLGFSKDNIETLLKAVEFLRKFGG